MVGVCRHANPVLRCASYGLHQRGAMAVLHLLRRMNKKSKIHETPALYHCPPAQPAVPADPRGRLAHFSTYFRAGG